MYDDSGMDFSRPPAAPPGAGDDRHNFSAADFVDDPYGQPPHNLRPADLAVRLRNRIS